MKLKMLLKKYLLKLLGHYNVERRFLKRPISQFKECKDFASLVDLVQAIKILIYYYLFHNRFFDSRVYPLDKKTLTMLSGYSLDKKNLTIIRGMGFFACCNKRLVIIGKFFNKYKKLPKYIDSTRQFTQYKPNNKKNIDITHEFFKETNINIQYTHPIHFIRHQIFSFEDIKPFVGKYFQPSAKVIKIIKNIENKYQLNNYNDLCALYYRGTDKIQEVGLPSYEGFLEKAKTLKAKHPEIKFLLQSDEPDFLEAGLKYFPDATFFEDENIPLIPKPYKNFEHALNFLAIVIVLSKCKYLIATTSNVSRWIIYYRGNKKNTMYYYSPNKYSTNYDKNKSFWSCELD